MVKLIRHMAIKKKLLLILFFSSVSAATFAGLFLFLLEISEFKKTTKEEISAIATLIGDRSTAALMFNDEELAQENLAALDKFPSVRLACIYDNQQRIFTQLNTNPTQNQTCPHLSLDRQTHYKKKQLYVFQPILVGNELQGEIYIHADLDSVVLKKFKHLSLVSLILFSASIVAFFILTPLLDLIASPIKKLVDTAKKITDENNYAIRAKKVNNDEVGQRFRAFKVNQVNQ